MKRLFHLSLLILIFLSFSACFSSATPSDVDSLSTIEAELHETGAASIPVTIAKLDSLDPSKVSITAELSLDTSVNLNFNYLTTQTNCTYIYTIVIAAGGVSDPTTTPSILIYNLTQNYTEMYGSVVAADGSAPIAGTGPLSVCGEAADQIMVSTLTAAEDAASPPVTLEIDATGSTIMTLTSSTNLAGSNNILVNPNGDIFAIVLDGAGGSSIYRIESDGTTGTFIATLTDIPQALTILNLGTTSYLYYVNTSGVLKQIEITPVTASVSNPFLVKSKYTVTATESTIEDFAVDADSSYSLGSQAANATDADGTKILWVNHKDSLGNSLISMYSRTTDATSGSIELSIDNATSGFEPGFNSLGYFYSFLSGSASLAECSGNTGCIVEVNSNELSSSLASPGETNEETLTPETDNILVSFDISTSTVTQVITVPAIIDVTAPAETLPNALYLKDSGQAFFVDNTATITPLEGSSFDISEPLVKIFTGVNSDGNSIILGCREVDDSLYALSVFVPSSDTSLSDQLANGVWQQLTSSAAYNSCNSDKDVTIGDSLNVYFFREDASDDVSQISLIVYEQSSLLQSGLIEILPE